MDAIRNDPIFIIGVLATLVVVSEHLVRNTFLKHVGSALLVIVLTAIVANLGLIPASSTDAAPVPVYDAIFAYLAPISLFLLLLHVNLRDVLRAGVPLLILFLIGSGGTMLGVMLGMKLFNGAASIGEQYGAIAGMFTGTYTGGSVNFNAVALEYGVVRDGVLYGGSVVVDNIITMIWMVVTLSMPRLLLPLWRGTAAGDPTTRATAIIDIAAETETVDPRKLALVLALSAGALWLSNMITAGFASLGFNVPSILVITTIALILAQFDAIGKVPGVRVIGMVGVYMFLAVIGAFCDVRALAGIGQLGLVLFGFAATVVLTHGLVTVMAARAMKLDPDAAAVASQANIGGGTSALALAKSLGREDLLVPGILLGSVGNAIGTFLGFWVASLV